MNRTEIEKIIKLHLPHVEVKAWDGNDLVVDVDVSKLERETIRGERVFTLTNSAKQADYIICQVLKESEQRNYLVIQ